MSLVYIVVLIRCHLSIQSQATHLTKPLVDWDDKSAGVTSLKSVLGSINLSLIHIKETKAEQNNAYVC